MATRRKGRKASSSGRGSTEAIEKRRTARRLNSLLTGGGGERDRNDGRTEKRRQRLVKELVQGRRGEELSPIDFVSHVDELLDLGETVASLKKQGVKQRRTEVTPEVLEVVRRTQEAYDFRPEAWRLLGSDIADAAARSSGGGGGRTAAGGKKKTKKAASKKKAGKKKAGKKRTSKKKAASKKKAGKKKAGKKRTSKKKTARRKTS